MGKFWLNLFSLSWPIESEEFFEIQRNSNVCSLCSSYLGHQKLTSLNFIKIIFNLPHNIAETVPKVVKISVQRIFLLIVLHSLILPNLSPPFPPPHSPPPPPTPLPSPPCYLRSQTYAFCPLYFLGSGPDRGQSPAHLNYLTTGIKTGSLHFWKWIGMSQWVDKPMDTHMKYF